MSCVDGSRCESVANFVWLWQNEEGQWGCIMIERMRRKIFFTHHRPKQIGCFIQITKNFCFVPFLFLNLLPKKTCVDVHKIIYTMCIRNADKLVTNLVFPMKFWLLFREFHFTNKSADKKSRKKHFGKKLICIVRADELM